MIRTFGMVERDYVHTSRRVGPLSCGSEYGFGVDFGFDHGRGGYGKGWNVHQYEDSAS